MTAGLVHHDRYVRLRAAVVTVLDAEFGDDLPAIRQVLLDALDDEREPEFVAAMDRAAAQGLPHTGESGGARLSTRAAAQPDGAAIQQQFIEAGGYEVVLMGDGSRGAFPMDTAPALAELARLLDAARERDEAREALRETQDFLAHPFGQLNPRAFYALRTNVERVLGSLPVPPGGET